MENLPESLHQPMDVDRYIDAQLHVYEIEVPGVARVFLAVNRKSVEESADVRVTPLIDANNAGVKNFKEWKPKLYKSPSYGGTRLEPYDVAGGLLQSRLNGIRRAMQLAFKESHVKHAYLNRTIEDGALDEYLDKDGNTTREVKHWHEEQRDIPAGFKLGKTFLDLAFRGGRCVIVPENEEIQRRLVDSQGENAKEAYRPIFEKIGAFLNGRMPAARVAPDGSVREPSVLLPEGALFLTPDFGPNRHLADWLHEYTPYVLGVRREAGGGGGKASYTVSGVMGGLEACAERGLFNLANKDIPITLIGSAGAMGSDLAQRLAERGYRNVRLCDTAYESNASAGSLGFPPGWKIVPASPGAFTDEALGNGGQENGVIITMAVGNELEHSNIEAIPRDTTLLLAQNLALPEKPSEAVALVKRLHDRNVTVIPGQALTPGGAGNSRLEIYWRAQHGLTKSSEVALPDNLVFPKRLGHENVFLMIKKGVGELLERMRRNNVTSVEAMSDYVNLPAFANDDVYASPAMEGAKGTPLGQEAQRQQGSM